MKSHNRTLTAPGILLTIFAGCMCLTFSAVPASAATQWDVGISGGEKGIEGFHLSVGDYYRVPEREVVVVHDRGIRDEDLPVVFFLSQRARVSPEAIVDLRLRGRSWMDITIHYGLSPDIYYVPVKKYDGPHGRAWGYYKKHPRHEDWRRIELRDRDIVDQVNLKFISDHYGYSPERVMRYRDEGRTYPVIDRDFKSEKHKKAAKKDHSKKYDKGKDKHDDHWKETKHEGKGKK